MSKHDQYDKELLTRINEVMHYLWDPINISDEPQCRDEYDFYTLHVLSLLKKKPYFIELSVEENEKIAGEICQEIADYLTKITSEKMELGQNIEHDKKITEILMEWKYFYEEKAGKSENKIPEN